jgi:hypothetical protein
VEFSGRCFQRFVSAITFPPHRYDGEAYDSSDRRQEPQTRGRKRPGSAKFAKFNNGRIRPATVE